MPTTSTRGSVDAVIAEERDVGDDAWDDEQCLSAVDEQLN